MQQLFDKKKIEMTMNLAKNDFKNKYTGSVLGMIWGFVPPFATILIYWFVFSIGFHIKPMGNVPYLMWLIDGLIPWFFFSECIAAVTNCFVEYSYLVKKVVFSIHIIPFVKMASSLFIHIFFLIMTAYIGFMYGYLPNRYYVQLIYYTFALICLIMSIGFITATLNIFLKDISQIVSLILQFGIWLVPILWNPAMFDSKLVFILKINPLFYIIQGYRDSLIYKVPVSSHIGYTIYYWCFIISAALLAKYIYGKMRVHFSDLL